MRRILLIAAALFFLPGCGESPRGEALRARVEPASPQQLAKIRERLNEGLTLAGGGLVLRSGTHKRVYYIAARIGGPGMRDESGKGALAVWVTGGGPAGAGGSVLAADNLADEFSDVGRGDEHSSDTFLGRDPQVADFKDYAEDNL